MRRRNFITGGISAVLSPSVISFAAAQGGYPTRPIRILVGSLAGGTTDVVARLTATALEKELQTPAYIENKAGAGGLIANGDLTAASPDGYVLQVGSTSTTTLAPLMQSTQNYRLLSDTAPISMLGTVPLALFVNPKVEAKTLQELIQLIKANPGKMAYASAGVGTTSHLTGEMMKLAAGGLDLLHVPYRGGPAMDRAVVTAEVQMSFNSPGAVLGLHREGLVQLLSVLSPKRAALAPEFPTAVESGYSALKAEVTFYMLAPAKTPSGIMNRLHSALRQITTSAHFRDTLLKGGIEPMTSDSPDEAAATLREELKTWEPAVSLIREKS